MNIVDIRMGRRSMGAYEHIANGRQKWRAGAHIPRHRHADAYAALVLSGGFQQCGNRGRFNVGPGDVLMHGAFDSHLDRIFVVGAEVLNLSLPGLGAIEPDLGRVSDPDEIARVAETDSVAAAAMLCERLTPAPNVLRDWPDLLAADLLEDPNRRLEDWAEQHQLALETLSRGFGRAFGITPVVFRSEARARRAFEQIVEGAEVLSKVLEASGFADQAHMSRAIRSLTGATPKSWLRRASFKSPLGA